MLSLTIPDSVLYSLKLPGKSVQNDLMKLLSVILYEKGALGIGKACELCGKSRIDFMQILDEEGVALNYDDAELDRDLANLESFL
jgi:predicted HTH domain antitoxin